MVNVPLQLAPREDWPDADFDFPEEGDDSFHAPDQSDKGDNPDDDDWDTEMDLGSTGGATLKLPGPGPLSAPPVVAQASTPTFTIRPPLHNPDTDLDDEDEGISTIKALGTLKKINATGTVPQVEDLEDDFALPDDMTQLSLRPLSLHHQSSRGSFEWSEKDHTMSSQSSDAFTSLGFTGSSASSASTSASLPETESEADSDDLEGLVIPTGLFESGQGSKHLTKLLERKKRLPSISEGNPLVQSPDPEDDFEVGLVIDDDADFSASRLPRSTSAAAKRIKYERSKSAPSTRPGSSSSLLRPARKAKSPPPPSSMRQFRQLSVFTAPTTNPADRPAPIVRANTLQTPSPVTPGFLGTKSASLRGQKSQSNMKPASPPGRPLTRKASLSSLEVSPPHGFQPTVQLIGPSPPHPVQRYESHTAASRAKSHTSSSTSRMRVSEFGMQQVQPSSSAGPSQRLTLPASISRQKSRPTVSGLFTSTSGSIGRSSSPLPRPPSSASHASSSKSQSLSQSRSTPPLTSSGSAPRFLRKPKKSRAYGDGTELDAFDDLPTDGVKESHFRVVPKSRSSSGHIPPQPPRSPPRIKTIPKRTDDVGSAPGLRRAGRIEVARKPSTSDLAVKKKTKTGSPRHKEQKRKPTLIRNLGGVGGPKVVGEMKWNPHTMRWEGNDQVLRDFEAASARPALITHLTGSSIGSPVASMNGGRQVGHMIFDPSKMCWISTLDPDEDEPDVFADLADDEEDEFAPRSAASEASTGRSRLTSPSPHSRAGSESADEGGVMYERGSRASLVVADVDDKFREECRKAEVRHRAEMVGWAIPTPKARHQEQERSRGYLYEIRALATRQY